MTDLERLQRLAQDGDLEAKAEIERRELRHGNLLHVLDETLKTLHEADNGEADKLARQVEAVLEEHHARERARVGEEIALCRRLDYRESLGCGRECALGQEDGDCTCGGYGMRVQLSGWIVETVEDPEWDETWGSRQEWVRQLASRIAELPPHVIGPEVADVVAQADAIIEALSAPPQSMSGVTQSAESIPWGTP